MQSLVVTNIEQRGDDTHADLQLRPGWIAAGRTVVVEIPLGETIQLTLSPVMTEGKQLRFKGKGPDGQGDLLLRVCITE